MWKNILLFCLFIAICFMVPFIFLDIDMSIGKISNDENKIIESGDIEENVSGDIIKLLLKESGKIIELSMDDYIKGVVLRRNADYV